jgi:transposase
MAYRINLTDKQEKRLRRFVHEHKENKNLLRRAYCILLRNEGQKNENITRLLNVHEDTIADWLRIYRTRGLDELLTYKFHKRRKSKLDKYRSRIKKIASRKKISTIEQLQEAIEEKLSLKVEYSWLYRYCVKNSIYSLLKNK